MAWALPPSLPREDLPPGSTLARIHWRGTTEPFFGPKPGERPSHRFHDPMGEFRVCFLGENPTASFAETFLRRSPVRLVTRDELARRGLTAFGVLRPLRLVKLHGNGLAKVGCTAQITSSDPPYDEPQRLSRELWLHPDAVDGISYLCRHDNDLRAFALYDRAADALRVLDADDLLADHGRLLAWSRRYGFALA
jgi:hypothetical protein